MQKIIGVDIGGTKCAVTFGEYTDKGEVKIIRKQSFPTEVSMGPGYTLDKIVKAIEEGFEKTSTELKSINGIGISCGGPLDSEKGIIMSPPNLLGWDNIHIVDFLENKIGIKTRLENDANACALAEWRFGAAKGYRNVIFLTFGTGMGAGLILDGRLYRGTNDMAGEIGHIRLSEIGPVGYGKSGSFEGFCSGGGISQLAGIKVLESMQKGETVDFCKNPAMLKDLNAKIVGDAAEAGNELAKEIYRISGHYLGKGVSILIDILNPEIIVIGSIYARSEGLLDGALWEVVNSECLSHSRRVCKIVPAGLGEKLGDYAALAVAVS